MKGIKKIGLVGIITAFTSLSAFAVTPLPLGWYAEGNIGATNVSNTNYGSGTSIQKSGVGYNVNLGYKFMPFFGLEIGGTKYANLRIKTAGTQIAKATNWSLDLAAKGILPVAESGFELFAKLGMARIFNNVSWTNQAYANSQGVSVNTGKHNSTGLYIGLGGEYYFTPNIAVVGQWARSKGSNTTGNLDLYSIGASYLFPAT